MKLIAGLGNPGRIYAHNRHNIGFMCLSYFAKTHSIRLDKKKGQARTGMGKVANNEVVLARPQTYMNASGESVSRLVKSLHITPSDVIVIHDDLDLPLGKIRIRQGGGSGGHKGLESIISYLGNQNFLRVRVGIGRPVIVEGTANNKEEEVIAYVLSEFTPSEEKTIADVITEVSHAIICLLTEGLTAAMNKYN